MSTDSLPHCVTKEPIQSGLDRRYRFQLKTTLVPTYLGPLVLRKFLPLPSLTVHQSRSMYYTSRSRLAFTLEGKGTVSRWWFPYSETGPRSHLLSVKGVRTRGCSIVYVVPWRSRSRSYRWWNEMGFSDVPQFMFGLGRFGRGSGTITFSLPTASRSGCGSNLSSPTVSGSSIPSLTLGSTRQWPWFIFHCLLSLGSVGRVLRSSVDLHPRESTSRVGVVREVLWDSRVS